MTESLHRAELEPCYSCKNGCRIPHFIGSEFTGESVTCQCPNKNGGCDNCQSPGAVIVIKGAC